MVYVNKFSILTFLLVLWLGSAAFLYAGDPPVLLNPANNSTCISTSPMFSWNNDPNVTSYNFQLALNGDFSSTVFDSSGIITTSIQRSLLLHNTTYYWRVTATFNDNSTAVSAVRNFTTKEQPPVLNLPVNDATCQPKNVNFIWDVVPGTINYWFQLSESPNFATLIINRTDLTTNDFSTVVSQYNKKYYWRVKAVLNDCETEWQTTPYNFTTVPAPPLQIRPADLATSISLTDTLKWAFQQGAVSYNVEISPDQTFSTGIIAYNNVTDTFNIFNVTQYNIIYYWRIKAVFNNCETDWSTARQFRTKYVQPYLSIPVDTAQCVPLTRNYVWLPSTGASSYTLQISFHRNFDTIVAQRTRVSATSAAVTLPLGLTTYYWRVKADDEANTSEWSSVFFFTTAPQYPVRLSPPDSAFNQPLSFNFLWRKVKPGALYNLQVSNFRDFQDTVLFARDITDTFLTANFNSYYHTYYWRIQTNDNGCYSIWSDVRMFRTRLESPIPQNPANNSINQPLALEFRWIAPTGAQTYALSIAKDPQFQQLILGEIGIPSNNYLVKDLQPLTTYYWRVNATNSDGTSTWSPTQTFTTGVQGPAVPILESPADDATMQPVQIMLKWNPAPRANHYHLQVSKQRNFSNNVVDNNNIPENMFSVALENYTIYYWRVRSVNDSGPSAWSQIRSFRTIAIAPDEIPQLLLPPNNIENQPTVITFSWNPVPRATGYTFQLSKASDFSSLVNESRDDATFRYINNLEINTIYYWRIQAYNEAGNSQWSQVRQLKTGNQVSVEEGITKLIRLRATPNPVNAASYTSIGFNLDKPADVRLSVFDMKGNEIYIIFNGVLTEGNQSFDWNVSNINSGTYIIKLEVNSDESYCKVIVSK